MTNRDRTPYQSRNTYFAGPGTPYGGKQSLHDARPEIDSDDGFDWDLKERSATDGATIAHFGDVKARLLDFIEGSQVLIGCVAWLTDFDILDALARKPVALIVQKEDFLRPDIGAVGSWPGLLQGKYANLSGGLTRFGFPSPLRSASYAGDYSMDPVRCVGNHNSAKDPAMPRMHHKFLVRATLKERQGTFPEVEPLAVWTGSFNFSLNAGRSFENAVEIDSEFIAAAYLGEFARVATLSEPLDWESEWVYPEWRIGT